MEAELGQDTGGVWTPAQARAAGLTRAQVRGRVERGEWRVVRRAVLVHGGVALDPGARAWAAVLAAGGRGRARAAGRTAARVYGLPLVDDTDPLLPPALRQISHDDVAVVRGLHGRTTLHPVRLELDAADRVLAGGVPCLSPLRTVVDLARLLTLEALVCALDAALREELVTRGELERELVRRVGHPYVDRLRRAVVLADGRAESPLETLVRLLLLPVLPALVPQVRVLDGAARIVARLDLGAERLRFGVEADSAAYHGGGAAWASDRRRETRLAELGWSLERVTWSEVRRDGAAPRARVLAAAARAAAISTSTSS